MNKSMNKEFDATALTFDESKSFFKEHFNKIRT